MKLINILRNWSDKDVFWLLFFLLLVFLIRLPVVNVSVLDWDESMYWTIAQDIADGGVPYKTTWDNKGPLLFFVFVLVTILFDNSIPALRIFTTFYLLVSMYLLYLMARKLLPDFVRLVPPLIYGLFFVIPNFQGFASNGELFMLLPVILSLLMYIDYEKRRSLILLFLSGFFSSLAFFIKGTAIFSVMVITIMFIYSFIVQESYNLKSLIKKLVYYFLGFLTPFIILNVYFWYNGALSDFYYAVFTANSKYVQLIPLSDGIMNAYKFMYKTILINYEIITLLAIASALYLLIELIRDRFPKNEKSKLYLILIISILSAVGVVLGKRMYPHYYLQMALPYSLLIAYAIFSLKLERKHIKTIFIVILVIYTVQSPLQKVMAYKDKVDLHKTDQYRSDHIESHEITDYIRNKTANTDKILVLGGQPIIYFLSKRKSPIKVFWWNDNYLETIKRITNFEGTFLSALQKDKPAYIIFYDGEDHKQRLRFDYFGEFIIENYSFETTIGRYKLYKLNVRS